MSDDVTPCRKSNLCDYQNKQEGAGKLAKGSGSAQPKNEALKLQLNDNTDTLCSDTWIFFQESEDLPWQPSNLGEYKQLSLLKLTPTHEQSCDRIFPESPFTQILETTTQSQDNLTSSPAVSPALAQVTQEVEQDLNIQLPLFGEKVSDALSKLNPASVFLNSLKELSDEDLELFLPPYIWQDTVLKLKQSRRESLEQDTKDLDCLSFPTLTSNENSITRPAGQTKCEKWFRNKGLVPNGSQLGSEAIAMIMGFPPNWFNSLSPTEPQEELEQDISQVEPSPHHKQRSPLKESSISIPCLVKQPKQPEVKGIIQKDEGDRFVVEVDGKEISVSKLFVYPDFSESDKQIPPTKQKAPPSKIPPTKRRRKKGDGTGYIYRRTITRRGKQYQEAYFRYRDESGKLKAKYIPQRLLDKVQELEFQKKPIADILFLLGGDEINRGEQSNNVPPQTLQTPEKSDELISISRGEQSTPPSNKKRKQGEGTGYIECKPIKRGGNEYKQYWYHYEEWREGDRKSKKSRYIPKRLVARVQKMEVEKAPVNKILEVLIGKNKGGKK